MDKSLLIRFFQYECSITERKKVIAWLSDPSNDFLIVEWMHESWELIHNIDHDEYLDEPDIKRMWLNVRAQIIKEKPLLSIPAKYLITPFFSNTNFRRIFSIAAVFIFLIGGYHFYTHSFTNLKGFNNKQTISQKNDIAPPAKNNAILILANGKKIDLDNSGQGMLANEDGINVVKSGNDEIVYNGSNSNKLEYNTLSLPKGSKPIKLVLADGSLVWLNSASSITYPTVFIGTDRKVQITGEAYFEVSKNASMPFYVLKEGKAIVKVLGTHFNVNTYDDENKIKVTLLEGSVIVNNGSKKNIIKPGEQAEISENNIQIQSGIDIEEVMSWKNGEFYFNETDLKSIMRQIEKYYNIEVEYKDNVNYRFYAKIDRQVNLSEVLKKLELTNLVHFKIESNKITVMK
jgi:hypothetical protein